MPVCFKLPTCPRLALENKRLFGLHELVEVFLSEDGFVLTAGDRTILKPEHSVFDASLGGNLVQLVPLRV